MNPKRAGRGLKRSLEAVGFVLAEFQPKRSHGDPIRDMFSVNFQDGQVRILSAKRMICSAKEGFKKVPGGRRIRSGEFLGAFGILLTSSGLLCAKHNIEHLTTKNSCIFPGCIWDTFDKFWTTVRRT